MSRPTVLLLDTQTERLREVSRLLAADGYDVVPLADAARAHRFVQGLESAFVVAAASALAASGDPAALRGSGRRLIVLAEQAPDEAARRQDGIPEDAGFLAIGGLHPQEISRRLGLVLLGRVLGVEPDARLTCLAGDLAQTPLLDLLRALHGACGSGRIDLGGGALALADGEVVAAVAGSARGLKALCRLSRLHAGPLRFTPGTVDTPREITEDLDTLVLAAIEDSLGDLPAPRTRVEIDLKPAFFTTAFSAVQQQILSLAQHGATVQQLVDGVAARDGEIVQEMLRLEELGLLTRREPEAAVQIVTDSTADLPPDLVRAHGIDVVPLSVAFGKEVFRDRVDLQPGRFYSLLVQRREHPVSSPPRREDFLPHFRDRFARGDEVISLHLSAKLSKTFENASAAAADELASSAPGHAGRRGRLTVLDTGQVSLGLGLLVLFAARLAARDEPGERIVRRIRDMAPRLHTLFVVDTLEFLARSGRIGKARALLGGLLRMKPILGLVDGEVAAVDQVRGGRNVRPRILELLEQRVDRERPVVVGISHGNAPAWADALGRLVRERLQVSELVEAEIGPVIGANVGPGVVAITIFQPTADESPWIAPLAS